MFVCTFAHTVFGVSDTPMNAFKNMLENAEESYGDDYVKGIEPFDCHFFEQIEVNIRENTAWSIEPQYED